MRSKWILTGMIATLVLTVGACVEGRSRPPTALEEATRDPNGPPLVFITHPQRNQVFFTDVWVSGSGVQVTYAGDFPTGLELRLLAFLDFEQYAETQPFHVTRFTIDESPPTAVFVRGQPDQFREATGVTLLLEIHDLQGIRISVDSVSTQIR